jgi:nucleotide-binding universal stress UspA family protein
MRLNAGDVIDGFELIERMAQGGMGTVWRARHPDHAFPIVMKVPFFDPGQDVSTIVGYEVEEMVLKRLSGPHVPKFCGSGDLAAVPYIAMEFVEGRNLGTYIEEIADNPQEIARIGALIATALASIHRQNVIHLDLKPDNIMIATRGAVLIDFGLSRHFDLPDLLGEESDVPMGTPAYIAPEQVMGNRSVFASDIFALGCILYEAATGVKPFGEPASTAGMKRRLHHMPEPVRALNKRIPRWLATVIAKCMETDPARRYANAGNVAFDLTHVDQIVVAPETRTIVGEKGGFLARMFKKKPAAPVFTMPAPIRGNGRAIVLAAVDLSDGADALAEEVRGEASRVLAASRGARLACLTVLKTELIGQDEQPDAEGRPAYVSRLVALRDWAQPLGLDDDAVSFHVVEAVSPGQAILNYASHNDVGHIVMGARASSALRRHLGSVSTEVVANALCSVSVVRVKRIEEKALQTA